MDYSSQDKTSKVGQGPKPDPSENEVVIKVTYAAVNPTDWKVRINLEKQYQNLTDTNIDARFSIL
jgi:NADPH:quinone reductase-like Zn-dependent oxidoreductase